MAVAKPSRLFPERYIEHVACAIEMVATSGFTEPPAAIAAVYLVTRFEYFFRRLSGVLRADGTWVSDAAQTATKAEFNDERLNRRRVSSVSLSYKIMKFDRTLAVSRHCDTLDRALYSVPAGVAGGTEPVRDLGDRIEYGRSAAAHGHKGDISSEALFYGLLTALIFYDEEYPVDGPDTPSRAS
jgi:hypothetical protein